MAEDTFTFNGIAFTAVVNNDVTPSWVPEPEATDRRLIGTERFERSIRSVRWVCKIDAWIEPSATARTAYEGLQAAFALGTVAGLIFPGQSLEDAFNAVMVENAMVALRGGINGYRGQLTFGRTP